MWILRLFLNWVYLCFYRVTRILCLQAPLQTYDLQILSPVPWADGVGGSTQVLHFDKVQLMRISCVPCAWDVVLKAHPNASPPRFTPVIPYNNCVVSALTLRSVVHVTVSCVVRGRGPTRSLACNYPVFPAPLLKSPPLNRRSTEHPVETNGP